MDMSQENSDKLPGQVYSDYTLEKIVKELLSSSKKLNDSEITVIARKGDITLKGTVTTEQQKDIAGSLAQLVHGVGSINNEIIVKIDESWSSFGG